MGMQLKDSDINDIMAVFDVDGAGTIELPEFLSFVKNQYKDSVARIQDIMETPCMVQKSNLSKKYIPPKVGILHLDVVDSFVKKKIYKVLTDTNQNHITKLARNTGGDVSKMLTYAVQNSKIRIAEAQALYKTMLHDIGDKARVLSKILPQMALHPEARQLVSKCTADDRVEISRIKQLLGSALRPIYGIPNGYYHLDLSKDMDRICLSKLLELSKTLTNKVLNANLMERGRIGDTSQCGDWSCFRNGLLNGIPITINTAQFTPMKISGRLEFDFSGSPRPLWGQTVISDSKLTRLLVHIAIMPITDKDKNITELAIMKEEANYAIGGNGKNIYECTPDKAMEIGLCSSRFYESLALRSQNLAASVKREEVKIDVGNDILQGSAPIHQLEKQPSATQNFYKRTDSVTANKNNGDSVVGTSSPSKSIRPYGRDNTLSSDQFNTKERNAIMEEHASSSRIPRVSVHRDAKDQLQNIGIPQDAPEKHLTNANSAMECNGAKDDVITSAMISEEIEASIKPEQASHEHVNSQLRFHSYMEKLLQNPNLTDHSKALRVLHALEDMVGPYWIRSRHLANIVRKFEIGKVDKVEFFGTYRVEIVVSLFCRVVDLHNFELVMRELSAYETACVYCRLGWLNVFNPMKPEGSYEFNLANWEERQVAKAFITLAVTEPGDNIVGGKFQWDRESDYIPGWEVTQLWLVDSTMCKKGFLSFTYYSGEGKGLKGCRPDVTYRKSLLQMVYCILYYL
jgi:hypothetical protein